MSVIKSNMGIRATETRKRMQEKNGRAIPEKEYINGIFVTVCYRNSRYM
jgi:hypothetical protein